MSYYFQLPLAYPIMIQRDKKDTWKNSIDHSAGLQQCIIVSGFDGNPLYSLSG